MAQQEDSPTEEEISLLIAGILAGTILVPNPLEAIGLALLALMPTSISHALAGRISAEITKLVVRDLPLLTEPLEDEITAVLDNLDFRGRYAVAATGRLVTAATEPGELSQEESVAKALDIEHTTHFEAHKQASDKRDAAATLINDAAREHGEVLGWYSVRDARTDTRCHELHGTNFDVSSPPDGVYPGTRDGGNCRCKPGSPF